MNGEPVKWVAGLIATPDVDLATHKNFAHRLAVGQGVFAELTLCFSRSGMVHHDWTYPDIRGGTYDQALRSIRADFMAQAAAAEHG